MIKEFIKRYQYIIYIGISFGMLDLYIRAVNRGILYISYFSLSAVLFTLAWIVGYLGLITLLKGKAQKIIYIFLLTICNFLMITNYIIIKIFGTAFSFSSISLADEGKEYIMMIPDYISLPLILVIIGSIALSIFGCKFLPKERLKSDLIMGVVLILTAISLFIGARFALGPSSEVNSWDTWMNKRNIYDNYSDSRKSLQVSGLFEYSARDLYLNTIAKMFENNEKAIKYLDKYYISSNLENSTSKYSSIFKDKNVIIILMESVDNWLVTEDKMPTLYNMMNTGFNFSNHFSPMYGGGATFNSEYMVNSGYMSPLNEESAANQYGHNSYPYSLANLFVNAGYTVNNFHENVSSFYNRKQISEALGYEHYYSSLEMGIESKLAVKDTHFMKVEKIRNLIIPKDEKFMSFITTYSLHGPYNTDESVGLQCTSALTKAENKTLNNGGNREEICIKAQARETDNFFKLLLEELEARDELDKTVIIGVTDHYTYSYSNRDEIYELKDTNDSNMIHKVPLFIWNSNIEFQEITDVNSNIDILPTIADLFGLDYKAKNYIGRNILSDDYEGYVFFSDYSWYDGEVYYKNGQVIQGEDVSENYIKKMNRKIDKTLKLNKYILDTDYFNNN